MIMKKWLQSIFFSSLCTSISYTYPTIIPALPASPFPDTEVSTNLALKAWNPDIRTFTLALELTASASNNVQVAFGRDLSGDGDLAPGETGFTTGWDCGEWFMASPSQRFPAPPVSADPHKVLTFSMHVDASGKPVSLAVRDGDTALAGFPVPGAVPPWLYSPAWNHLKITARGIDPAGETIQVRLVEDGARIILR
jgi:hypothetical protein